MHGSNRELLLELKSKFPSMKTQILRATANPGKWVWFGALIICIATPQHIHYTAIHYTLYTYYIVRWYNDPLGNDVTVVCAQHKR